MLSTEAVLLQQINDFNTDPVVFFSVGNSPVNVFLSVYACYYIFVSICFHFGN